MSTSLNFKFGLLSAVLSCLLAGSVAAQQSGAAGSQQGQGSTGRTAAQRDNSARSATSGQSGRASAGQSDRSTSQGSAAQPGTNAESRTANFRGEQGAGGASQQEVDQFFAGCLLAGNQAEVELAELAQQTSQNPQVKQFAAQMILDHRPLVQKLQQVAMITEGAGGSGSLQMAAQIDKQIADRKLQMAKEELQQKSVAEFDKCYIGMAIGAHGHMVAALEVIGQQSQGQLAQLAQQAQPKTQEHLDHAKMLMKELEIQSANSGAQAERSSSRKQR